MVSMLLKAPGGCLGKRVGTFFTRTGVNIGVQLRVFVLPFFRREMKVKITSSITGEPCGAAAEGDPRRNP